LQVIISIFFNSSCFSPVLDAYRANMLNEFEGTVIECPHTATACNRSEDEVFRFFALEEYGLWTCVGALFALTAGYLVIAFVLLRIVGKPKSNITISNYCLPKMNFDVSKLCWEWRVGS
jgi:hypothetical protein